MARTLCSARDAPRDHNAPEGALEKALAEPSIVSRFADLGTVLFPTGRRGPDEARDQLRSEVAKWERVIREAGLRAQQ